MKNLDWKQRIGINVSPSEGGWRWQQEQRRKNLWRAFFVVISLAAVDFVNIGANNFQLADSSRLKNKATDSKNIGCDFAALTAMEKKVIEG